MRSLSVEVSYKRNYNYNCHWFSQFVCSTEVISRKVFVVLVYTGVREGCIGTGTLCKQRKVSFQQCVVHYLRGDMRVGIACLHYSCGLRAGQAY